MTGGASAGDRAARERLAVGLVCLVSAAAQAFAQRDFLHDGILHSAGGYRDALEYAALASFLAEGRGFAETFASGWRLPGYPAFLALFQLFSEAPWRAARYAQIVAAALLPGLAYGLVRSAPSAGPRLVPALAVAAWPPLYYYTVILTPESLTVVLSALLYVLVFVYRERPAALTAVAAALVVVGLTSLKPNNVLLALPAAAAVWLRPASARSALRFAATVGAVVFLAVAPWSLFASLSQGRFVALATTQGLNLCVGAGGLSRAPAAGGETVSPSLMDTARRVLAIDVKCYREDSSPVADAELAQVAAARWLGHPFATLAFGLVKVLHLLGFSLRGPADWGSAGLTLGAIAGALLLRRRENGRALAHFYIAVLALAAVQAVVFQGDQRFRVMWVDFLAAVVLGAAVAGYLGERRRTAAGSAGGGHGQV